MPTLSSTVGPMRRFAVGDDVVALDKDGQSHYGVLVEVGPTGQARLIDLDGTVCTLLSGTFACPCYVEGRRRHDALCGYARSTAAENEQRRVANLERVLK